MSWGRGEEKKKKLSDYYGKSGVSSKSVKRYIVNEQSKNFIGTKSPTFLKTKFKQWEERREYQWERLLILCSFLKANF